MKSLEVLGLLDRFDTMVCAGDYKKSKPDPEPFLMAAERLGIAPADCLVFEDTELGIESAKAAGMSWVEGAAALGAVRQGIGCRRQRRAAEASSCGHAFFVQSFIW